MDVKLCRTCKNELPTTSFYELKTGLNWQCISCHKQRMRDQAKKNSGRDAIPEFKDLKKCSTCKVEKPAAGFNRSKIAASGLCNVCKDCEKSYKESRSKKYKERNSLSPMVFPEGATKKCSRCKSDLPVGFFTKDMARHDGLKAICKSCSSVESRNWRFNNLEKALFKSARSGAMKRGLEFSITLNDIVIPERCPIFGFVLSLDGKRSTSASIDRIDNLKGYIPGNVVVVSLKANHVKSDCTIDELRRLVKFYERLTA